jgi:1,4-alpha-glucan branching enzyme
MEKKLALIKNDSWLEPYKDAIEGRHQYALDKESELTNNSKTLSDFATGYLYFGLHLTNKGWTIREWAPNATHIYLIGTFNDWKESSKYELSNIRKWKLGIESANGFCYIIWIYISS